MARILFIPQTASGRIPLHGWPDNVVLCGRITLYRVAELTVFVNELGVLDPDGIQGNITTKVPR